MQGTHQIIRLQVPGPRSQCICCFSAGHLQSSNQNRQYGDKHAIRHHKTAFSHKPQYSFNAFFGRPAGQVPVHTDEDHAVIIPQKAGDNKNSFCNYLALELKSLEDKDYQTFRNKAVKLLSSFQMRAEERGHQPQQPALAAKEYILIIPETQMSARQVIQPTQQSQVATKGQLRQTRELLTSLSLMTG